jgi:hypothetical protein
MRLLAGGARAGPMEILVYPRILILQQSIQGIGDHAPADDDPDSLARSEQGIQIVGNHDHGEPKLGMKVQQ